MLVLFVEKHGQIPEVILTAVRSLILSVQLQKNNHSCKYKASLPNHSTKAFLKHFHKNWKVLESFSKKIVYKKVRKKIELSEQYSKITC